MSTSTPQSVLPVAEPDLTELEERYVLDAVRSGWVSSIGEYVNRFEHLVGKLAETPHAVAVANGTVALHLALVAMKIGPGDEVIIPDLTFAATAAAVVQAGATPVLVDVSATSWCLDPELVETAVTPRTRAIIAVHLFGHPCQMDALSTIAKKHGLRLIEDAAEAHGARFDGKRVGGLGDAGCFSFYGNKLVTTGEGGAITLHDSDLMQRVRFLKDHAMRPERRYFHTEVGYNYRLTNLQAALGCAQLERFETILQKKQNLLSMYRATQCVEGATLNPHVPPAEPVCWLVSVRLAQLKTRDQQQGVIENMRRDYGVDSRPFFVPMHELPPYQGLRLVKHGTSVASSLATQGLCLPSSSKMTSHDVDRVWSALRACLA